MSLGDSIRNWATGQSDTNGLAFSEVKAKACDECSVETFGISIPLHVVLRRGEILYPEERTKRQEEFAYNWGLVVGQQLVWYTILDNPMGKS